MIRYLEKLILDNWGDWVGGERPERLDFLKTHAGHAIRNKKVGFFIFNKTRPILFIKTVREEQYNDLIRNGFEKLKNIYKYLNNDSIPRPIYLGSYQGTVFSLEDAIIGKQFHSCKKTKDLKKFLKWFFEFQRLSLKKKKFINLEDYINGLINEFLSLYELEKEIRKLIKEISEDLKTVNTRISLPSILQHGDLTPDNVLDCEGELKAIDWDNFSKIDLPLFDLLVFLQRWSGIRDVSFVYEYSSIIKKYLKEFKIEKQVLKSLVFCYYLLDFLRKKRILTDYDKGYLKKRLKEIKKEKFEIS